MKRNLFGILTLVVLSLMFAAAGANAQTNVKADVPFAFMVGNAQMPAGSYTVSEFGQGTMLIRSGNSSASAISLVRSEEGGRVSPRLVFLHSGNDYFLTQVWGQNGDGKILPTTKLEKELLASDSSSSSSSNQEVIIALK